MKTDELDRSAVEAMLIRIKSAVPTMAFSDVRTVCRLSYLIGYEKAKKERIADIELFRK